MILTLIAAMDKNRGIGKDNRLLWHLPADMAHFKKATMGKPVIVGRKTYESFGARPLPGRRNIVLTKNPSFDGAGADTAPSLKEAIALAADAEEVMVIGGSAVYEEALPSAMKMVLTLVEGEFEADAWFPAWNYDDWKETSRKFHAADEKNSCDFTIVTFEKK